MRSKKTMWFVVCLASVLNLFLMMFLWEFSSVAASHSVFDAKREGLSFREMSELAVQSRAVFQFVCASFAAVFVMPIIWSPLSGLYLWLMNHTLAVKSAVMISLRALAVSIASAFAFLLMLLGVSLAASTLSKVALAYVVVGATLLVMLGHQWVIYCWFASRAQGHVAKLRNRFDWFWAFLVLLFCIAPGIQWVAAPGILARSYARLPIA
jgi:hypothetical protein